MSGQLSRITQKLRAVIFVTMRLRSLRLYDPRCVTSAQQYGPNSCVMSPLRDLGGAHMLDPLADTTARLERLVEDAIKKTDPDKSDELGAEIWQVLRERDEVRKALRIAGRDG